MTSVVAVGQAVTGPGIPVGTTIQTILNGIDIRLTQNITQANPTLSISPNAVLGSLGITPTITVNSLQGGVESSMRYQDATLAQQTVANYAVQYVGKININNAGGYHFFASPDDAARIYIDGMLVLNNDGGKGAADLSSALVQLGAGYHDIRVDYIQGTGGGSLNLGYSASPTGTRTSLASIMYRAETNTAGGASSAVNYGNDVVIAGNSGINLKGVGSLSGASAVQLGALKINTGTMLTLKATTTADVEVAGGGGGFGQTIRFGGTTGNPTTFGHTAGGAGTVTLFSNPNLAFDGVVTDGGRNMTVQKTGTGRLFFNQTAEQNILGVGTILAPQGSVTSVTGTTSVTVGQETRVTATTTAGLTPGMTVTGAGIPEGAFITSIDSATQFTMSTKATAAATTPIRVSTNPSLVLKGSTATGAFNPIGSATVSLDRSNLILDSKSATLAGVGPTFLNNVEVNREGVIQSILNAATTTLGSSTNSITINSAVITSDTTNLSTTVNVPSGTSNLHVGQIVTGAGIQAGTTIASITNGTSIVLSKPATVTAGGASLTYGGSLVLDAIAGGLPTSDPGATLTIDSPITGGTASRLVIRSTVMNAETTVTALEAPVFGVPQRTGNANVSRGIVALSGNNSGFLGTLEFEPEAGLRIEGASAYNSGTFALNRFNNLFLVDDLDGTGSRQSADFNHNITLNNSNTISVGRLGTAYAPYFGQAVNKTMQIESLTISANPLTTLTLANNNGYGLQVTGATTLQSAPTFQVNNASASNVVQGLTLSGEVSGAMSIAKNGNGTLVLENAGNTFGGSVSATGAYGLNGSAVLTMAGVTP
ncbi:MAG: hypothetical protein IPK32_24895 [Verrucomicrobiaceae bacterium]|nr:hypothetical protein [Verrucomicrobiaceae bacterium]